MHVQHIILDALFALGKTEDDIAWVTVPTIIRLNAALIDNCYEYLRPKRKPRSVTELYTEQHFRGYLAFSREELMQALAHDDRFELDADRGSYDPQVKVRRSVVATGVDRAASPGNRPTRAKRRDEAGRDAERKDEGAE